MFCPLGRSWKGEDPPNYVYAATICSRSRSGPPRRIRCYPDDSSIVALGLLGRRTGGEGELFVRLCCGGRDLYLG